MKKMVAIFGLIALSSTLHAATSTYSCQKTNKFRATPLPKILTLVITQNRANNDGANILSTSEQLGKCESSKPLQGVRSGSYATILAGVNCKGKNSYYNLNLEFDVLLNPKINLTVRGDEQYPSYETFGQAHYNCTKNQ